ncbi:sodium:proton antiporter [Roseococcus pinisoli]|uniref:Sodium:proton antiporter n=1 Tax=Roseococcus pinisoli TaxID=2835040 RepID=A0ABS5QDC1_9PROT|nr:sodium:proton antiporter [Roseococcus pinisoli]MBS7811695.1 sodium:proton antiporter [Roseococcus pinisoli]
MAATILFRGVLAALLTGLALPAAAAEGFDGAQLSLVWGLPFAGILLSIALLPILAPGFWHHHYGKISVFWGAAFLLPFALAYGLGAAGGEVAHVAVQEYIPFVALLTALYATGGGVLLRGSLQGTPLTNTVLLTIGTVLASVMGTTGASMLLIRPVLRANAKRRHKTHTFVFFIFLVANIGGSLTPIGDPPLYLGFLKGVSFFWPTTHLFVPFLFCAAVLLSIYFALDSFFHAREPALEPDTAPREKLRILGASNIFLIGVVVFGVLMQGIWQPGEVTLLGERIGLERLAAIALFALVTVVSLRMTPRELRLENGFGWGAMVEVAKLFAAIFLCMAPVLAILKAGPAGAAADLVAMTSGPAGEPIPWVYFWLTGALSSFLDNAPTYLVFFNLAGGDAAYLMGPGAATLAAISAGAVFMGANSYIGNAPNFMVKAIVEESGVRMPSFFGYCAWALVFLVPLFILCTFLFFR